MLWGRWFVALASGAGCATVSKAIQYARKGPRKSNSLSSKPGKGHAKAKARSALRDVKGFVVAG